MVLNLQKLAVTKAASMTIFSGGSCVANSCG